MVSFITGKQAGDVCPSTTYVQEQPAYGGGYSDTPASGYTSYSQPVQSGPPASCPVGTTPQNDGTCLTSQAAFSTSAPASSQVDFTNVEVANIEVCPVGTKLEGLEPGQSGCG